MTSELYQLLQADLVSSLFQPVVDSRTARILGFEALSRGPSDSPLHPPAALFEAARREDLTAPLDFVCFRTAVRRFATLQLDGRLFVNLTPDGLRHLGEKPGSVIDVLAHNGLEPGDLVFELTEQAILGDFDEIRGAMRALKDAGVAFAIDDLGAGYSGLRAWSELGPEYVKIDRYFTSSIDDDPLKMEFVRAIIDMARAARSTVIAEGVETLLEARELIEAGVDYLQGYYVARPAAVPARDLATRLRDHLPARASEEAGADTALALVIGQESIPPSTPVAEVAERFHQHVDRQAFAIVDDGHPVGIVRRSDLLDLLSIPLRRELYAKRPIADLMDDDPLVVDANLRLEQVSRLVTNRSRRKLYEQFIVTDRQVYRGMARSIDLLEQITQQRVQIARYANPLTSLPGNVPIYDCVNGLIRREQSFVLCQFDVDNFKPFNDFYGYGKGDEALVGLGRILRSHVSPRIDFVGHVGGDDFVVVFRSPDWELRVERIFRDFEQSLGQLYRPEHLEAGGIFTTDRYGEERRFPLLSLSAAALVCNGEALADGESLAYHLAPLKAEAKREPGSVLKQCSVSELAADDGAAPELRNASAGSSSAA